eukprot:MONOS_6996.1-p1 / transcript=MONOS_6996.1 / gene=MONOS_6996 / organism=Monocercomonoides_exilis_PA203 / gene_product=unspecified product / transcript_product=unspecified product / location=Mono_scaffold00230:48165-48824(+) / protein_length=139 / sequence_SO=supercontig / SO=protein_coding / is_pseudo=false
MQQEAENLQQIEQLTAILSSHEEEEQIIMNDMDSAEQLARDKLVPELSEMIRGYVDQIKIHIEKSMLTSSELHDRLSERYMELLQTVTGPALEKLKGYTEDVSQLEALTAGPDARMSSEYKKRANALLDRIARLNPTS